ncbi:MAG TPA: cobalamin-independent methionine synthase II family protein [Baekduia sp.]|nr:cobalamin-independent methionine synthase II family protein [Baekduia sp.]
MKRSTDRILTSHVGSLPRPKDLRDLYGSKASEETLNAALSESVDGIVKRQRELGLDVVNDGDYGKPSDEEVDYSAWMDYTYQRLSGFEVREFPRAMFIDESDEFADFHRSQEAAIRPDNDAPIRMGVNVGEIKYVGHEQAKRDVANLKAALDGDDDGLAFISATTIGSENFAASEFYATPEEQAVATAEAMREEFKIITDAGLIVQIDDPWIVSAFEWEGDGFDKWVHEHIELLNHSIEGIPSEQIRFHLCWGSDKGPHVNDMPLAGNLETLFKLNVGLYSVEASNPRHEHEWRVWEEADLPDGKIVMPGVITHKTNIVEHPEVVADRIVQYANAVGRENVIAGTDCGMGGRVFDSIVWAKFKALAAGAEIATKRLWK